MKHHPFITIIISYLLLNTPTWANPYWDKTQVPRDKPHQLASMEQINRLKIIKNAEGLEVLRIQVDWDKASESYHLNQAIIEYSGTEALLSRSTYKPAWGSYLGVLTDKKTGIVYYDSIGTGKEYRKLARAISLRFPLPENKTTFELFAENPLTGVMEKVLEETIHVTGLNKSVASEEVEIRALSEGKKTAFLRVNIYAEGYTLTERSLFWQHALKAVEVLENFPGSEYLEFYGVFSISKKKLGKPEDLGYPVPTYDSFLGLYYPYWNKFGRWYHVVYPTNEDKFRSALASFPYDYPVVLVNDGGYWGVGNYMSHTAIPAKNKYYFSYLLMHEFGHFFGLNEEYEGGGPTELEFAPDTEEPWSQNITFLTQPHYEGLKWNRYVEKNRTIPTPKSEWQNNPPTYGAYRGGYADSISTKGVSHKPGLQCIMDRFSTFCDICSQGIRDVIAHNKE